MLLASQATLTELRLGLDVQPGSSNWHILWPLRFPHLRVFNIGTWEHLNLFTGLESFLIGHRKTLQKFEFEHSYVCGLFSITFSPTITEELKIKSINGSGKVITGLLLDFPDMLGPTLESISLARHCDKMLRNEYRRECVYLGDDVKAEDAEDELDPPMEEEDVHVQNEFEEEFTQHQLVEQSVDNATIDYPVSAINEEDHQVPASDDLISLDDILPENPGSVRAQLESILNEIEHHEFSPLVSNLKSLHVPFEDGTSYYCFSIRIPAFDEIMEWCATTFPSLEVMSGPIPEIRGMTAEKLGETFGRFSSLKRVDFDLSALGDRIEQAREAVIALGTHCRTLKTINVFTSRETAVSMKLARTRQPDDPDALEVCTIAEESTINIEQKTLSQTTPDVCSCRPRRD
jgi:hypothetical protein